MARSKPLVPIREVYEAMWIFAENHPDPAMTKAVRDSVQALRDTRSSRRKNAFKKRVLDWARRPDPRAFPLFPS